MSEPAVDAAAMAPPRFMLPRPTSKPASGSTSSDGMGGKTCSTAISTTSPAYPSSSIRSLARSPIDASRSIASSIAGGASRSSRVRSAPRDEAQARAADGRARPDPAASARAHAEGRVAGAVRRRGAAEARAAHADRGAADAGARPSSPRPAARRARAARAPSGAAVRTAAAAEGAVASGGAGGGARRSTGRTRWLSREPHGVRRRGVQVDRARPAAGRGRRDASPGRCVGRSVEVSRSWRRWPAASR